MGKHWGYFALIIGLLFFLACGEGTGASQPKEPQAKIITLEVGKGQDLIKVVFDTTKAQVEKADNAVVVTNAIVDWAVPFKAKKTSMTSGWVAGEVLVNRIEMVPAADGKTTAVIVRYTTAGTGGGQGKLGISLVLGLFVDKPLLAGESPLAFTLPSKGTLTASAGQLGRIAKYVKADLALAKAQSKAYTMLAGAGKKDSRFIGFALWDPTNEKSRTGAYFEFSSTQSSKMPWSMTGTDK